MNAVPAAGTGSPNVRPTAAVSGNGSSNRTSAGRGSALTAISRHPPSWSFTSAFTASSVPARSYPTDCSGERVSSAGASRFTSPASRRSISQFGPYAAGQSQ